jgi:hypothetical protein
VCQALEQIVARHRRLLPKRETQAELMVWAKVRTDAWTGKRHAFTEIPLTADQDLAIRRLIWESFDPHLQFCLQHEREHNPDCPF